MNGPNGRKFKYGKPEQQAAFENVHLLWQEHSEIDAKLKAANAPPPPIKPPSISIAADKMPADVQSQIVSAAGLNAPPSDFANHASQTMNRDIAKKIIPDTLYTSQLHKPETPPAGGESAGPSSSNPTRKLRK